MEGPTVVDDPDDDLEAVDVAEYLGGASFSEAEQVLASQLKHSTRHPELAWTVARLCKVKTRLALQHGGGTKPAGNRSVLRDLAEVYRWFLSDHGREEVLAKLRVFLVSNQPVDATLEHALASAAAIVRITPGRITAAALLKLLQPAESDVIKALWDSLTGKLRSENFCDFLTVLDLSECGRSGRFQLERDVRAQVAQMAPDRTESWAKALYDLVYHEALPDRSRTGLRKRDVLAALGVADTRSVYPAPSRVVEVSDPLPAPSAGTLAQAILAGPSRRVIAYGAAGAGKSTTLTQLRGYLPEGSHILVYDSFGAGEYLSAGEERHTARRFVTQIVNELSSMCGTPLLLQPPTAGEDLWRRLGDAVRQAAHGLPDGGRLVLAVDAADNAAYAAERMGTPSFLPDLGRLPLPDNAAVVLTAREHRLGGLGAPNAEKVPLASFDESLSVRHLQRYFPDATQGEGVEFHERSGGNPRGQFYVLDRARREDWDIARTLEACRRTPAELFEGLVESALQISGTDIGGVRWLAMLTALARPVSLNAVSSALNVSSAEARAFAAGLDPGVRIEADAIASRDEDFEQYVRAQLTIEDLTSAHSELADLFLSTRYEDADAAEYVAEHLAGSHRPAEVVQLVLDDLWPTAITDEFQRLRVQGHRLDLALRAAQDSSDSSQRVRLVMRAAAAAANTHTLTTLVRDNVELVARHADPATVALQHLQVSADEWLGATHMRAAGILSRTPTPASLQRRRQPVLQQPLQLLHPRIRDLAAAWRRMPANVLGDLG